MFKFNSIQVRFTALLFLLMLLSAVALSWITYSLFSESIRADRIRVVGGVVAAKHEQLDQMLKHLNESAGIFLSRLINDCGGGVKGIDHSCANKALRDYVIGEKAIGATLSQPGNKDRFSIGIPAGTYENVEFKPGQLAGFEKRGTADVGKPYFIKVDDPGTGYRLLVLYPLDQISAIFNVPEELGNSGETFLTDSNGFFITKARYPATQGHDHPIKAKPLEACLGSVRGEMLDLDYRDALIIHGFQSIPEIGGGCVMAHISQAEAFSSLSTLKWRWITAMLAFMGLILAATYYFVRTIVRPITNLGKTARVIAAGNLSARAVIETHDEIGDLALSFNFMINNLNAILNNLRIRDTELLESKKMLESRVAESTRELNDALNLLEKSAAISGAISKIAPVGHIVADSGGTIISVNPAAENMFGYAAGELPGKNVTVLAPTPKEDEYSKYIRDYADSKKTGLPDRRSTIRVPKELLAIRRNGEFFYISLYVKEVLLSGEFVFIGLLEDITERRKAKIALTEAVENSDAIMNASDETLALIGEEGNFIAINDAGAKRLNSKPADIVGKAIFQVLPLKLAMSRLEYFKQVARTGKPISFEDERDGRFIANSIYPVIGKNAQVTRFALFAVDITERKKMETEIVNANRRYASLIDNIRVTVYLLSPEGHLTFISKPVALLTGRQPDDFLEKRVLWEDILVADDRGKYDGFRQSIFSNISANSLQYRVKRTDGTTAWVFDQCIPILDDAGDVVCFQGTIGDLTKFKEIEQMKEDFYHAVVHDLKSPITGIQLELDMLGDQIASFSAECSTKEPCQRTFSGYEASLKQKVADVGEGLSQLYLMILSLLKLGEIEEEKLELHYEPFAMNDLLGELEHDFRGRAAAKGLAIEFRNAFAGTVIADFKLLKRVLQNLVDNALKYSDANTAITVDASCAKKEGGCENIIISVTNTGQPLTENKINALFQKFKTLGHAESGSGIGLFFCYKTMDMLGGGIYVDQDTETITFHIFFPNG